MCFCSRVFEKQNTPKVTGSTKKEKNGNLQVFFMQGNENLLLCFFYAVTVTFERVIFENGVLFSPSVGKRKVIEHQFYQNGNSLCKKIWMALHVKKTLELKIALEINIFFLLCFRSVFITWCKFRYKFFCHKKGKILILPRVNDFCPKSVFHFFGSKVQG